MEAAARVNVPDAGARAHEPHAERGLAALDVLLALCVERDATDLHLAPGEPPVLRLQGELERVEGREPLSADELAQIADALLGQSGRSALHRSGSQDGALAGPSGARFRFNVFRRMGGLAIALRRLEDEFRTLQQLGLPESLYELCELPDGLVVLAGPTGAGKSTTLASLIDRINRTRRAHVITIEDPIEYVHPPRLCLVNQRQVGSDTASFHDALVAALREDPDVILLGEARDLDTMRAALRAAETGHLVFTTVHAGDCAGAIERLISVFPAEEQAGVRRQLALVLRAIVAQRLLVGGTRIAGRPRTRVVASEVLRTTPAVANLIATGRSAQLLAAIESGGQQGMQVLEQDLARLVSQGLLSEATALAHARSADDLRLRMGASAQARRAR